MSASQLDDAVLARYLAGECDAAEVARVVEWLRLHPARAAEFEDLRRVWSLARRDESRVDTDAAWLAVASRIRAPQSVRDASSSHSRPTVRRPAFVGARPEVAWRRFVAIGVAAAVLGVAFILDTRSSAERRALVEAQRDTMRYAAKPGQRTVIELADGTRIVLAPASELMYVHQPSGVGPRVAHLTGEAVFTVTHDAARPFLVYAKNGVTIDVGTRFGIRAYPNEALRVAVDEGRVLLTDDVVPGSLVGDSLLASLPNATLLGAGDVATRASDRTETVVRGTNVDALLAWEDGPFVFTHVSFGTMLPDLARWYGLTVRVTDRALLAQKVSGRFELESQEEVVRALATALGARHRRVGDSVTFSPSPK